MKFRIEVEETRFNFLVAETSTNSTLLTHTATRLNLLVSNKKGWSLWAVLGNAGGSWEGNKKCPLGPEDPCCVCCLLTTEKTAIKHKREKANLARFKHYF